MIFRHDALIAAAGTNVTFYDDNELVQGAIYRYNVKATNSFGDSETCSVAIARTSIHPMPSEAVRPHSGWHPVLPH